MTQQSTDLNAQTAENLCCDSKELFCQFLKIRDLEGSYIRTSNKCRTVIALMNGYLEI